MDTTQLCNCLSTCVLLLLLSLLYHPSLSPTLCSQVGVRFSKLMALEDKYPRDAEKAREEIVDLWLEKDPNPTWAKLADAFDHAGQRALGKKIRETYNCELKKLSSCVHMKKHVYSILAQRKRKNLPHPSTQNTDNNIPKHTKTQTITYKQKERGRTTRTNTHTHTHEEVFTSVCGICFHVSLYVYIRYMYTGRSVFGLFLHACTGLNACLGSIHRQ